MTTEKQIVAEAEETDFLLEYCEAAICERLKEDVLKRKSSSIGSKKLDNLLYIGARSLTSYQELHSVYEHVDYIAAKDIYANQPFGAENRYKVIVGIQLIDWHSPKMVLANMLSVLMPDGELLFTFYGAQTGASIRKYLGAVDEHPHFMPFYPMNEIGDYISGLGLTEVVIESEVLNVEYTSVEKLLSDAQMLEGRNSDDSRHKGLTSKARLQRVRDALSTVLKENGVINLEVEFCIGRGKKRNLSKVKVMVPSL